MEVDVKFRDPCLVFFFLFIYDQKDMLLLLVYSIYDLEVLVGVVIDEVFYWKGLMLGYVAGANMSDVDVLPSLFISGLDFDLWTELV